MGTRKEGRKGRSNTPVFPPSSKLFVEGVLHPSEEPEASWRSEDQRK